MTNGVVAAARNTLFVVGLLAVVGVSAYTAGTLSPRVSWGAGPPAKLPDVAAAFRFLKREPLSFLVTERVVTQVVTEAHNGNLILGYGNGLLVGKVELLYGVDLAELDLDAVELRGETIHVRVPEPRLLTYDPDLTSLRYIEKKSALLVAVDRVRDESLLRRCLGRLEAAAGEFAATSGLVPRREELVSRLNDYAPALRAQVGARVVFE